MYFGPPQTDDGQTIEKRKKVKPSNPKYRESQNTGTAPFGVSQGLNFLTSPWIRLVESPNHL